MGGVRGESMRGESVQVGGVRGDSVQGRRWEG